MFAKKSKKPVKKTEEKGEEKPSGAPKYVPPTPQSHGVPVSQHTQHKKKEEAAHAIGLEVIPERIVNPVARHTPTAAAAASAAAAMKLDIEKSAKKEEIDRQNEIACDKENKLLYYPLVIVFNNPEWVDPESPEDNSAPEAKQPGWKSLDQVIHFVRCVYLWLFE